MSENVATPEAPAAPVEQAPKAQKVVSPDLNFVNDVIKSGGESLKKCYQCATCTVVCNVTPEDNPFPRKEMVQAQWGLKDDLFRNPDIWLCHQCSDCTAHCPRGAKPGEVLGAIRKMSIARHSKPAFMARLAGSPAGLAPLLALPIVLFLIFLKMVGHVPFINALETSGGKIVFSDFLPLLPYLDGTFITIFTLAAVVLGLGVLSYWKDMSKAAKPEGSLVGSIIGTVKDILLHDKFSKCDVASGRKLAHMLVFFGFVLLAIATAFAGFYEWVLHLHGPYPFSDPIKWFGVSGSIALAAGFVLVVINRLAIAGKAGIGSYYDWLLIGVIIIVGTTGILSMVLRLANLPNPAYTVYFLHLVSIFFLFAYAPYTKMAHMVYRTTAMVFSRMTGRD
jgi:quinone-modifying oxidoreductase subunit QmoC